VTLTAPEGTALEAVRRTLAYMAPEQTGRMNRSVDFRSEQGLLSDVYEHSVTSVPVAFLTDRNLGN
jgi:hypothetical protein